MAIRIFAAAVAAILGLVSFETQARLVPPPGFYAPVKKTSSGEKTCDNPPAPFTGPLEFPSKYEGSGPARDVLNPQAYQKYLQMTDPIHTLEKDVSSMTGRYLAHGSPEMLQCVLQWLGRWSEADALEGEAKNHTGKSARKWALASVASAYLRLEFSSSRPLQPATTQAAAVQQWIGKLGQMVVSDWKDQPADKINNHQYWAAWSTMAASVVTDRRELFDWSVSVFKTAMRQVDESGYLPNELKRESRALAYHNYALGPLVMIAAFAKANGVDLRGENNGALQRLAERVLTGLDDPHQFEVKAGKKQALDDIAASSKFSWLEPYCKLYECSSGPAARRLAMLRPLKTYRLGGNLTELFAPEALPSKKKKVEDEDEDEPEPG